MYLNATVHVTACYIYNAEENEERSKVKYIGTRIWGTENNIYSLLSGSKSRLKSSLSFKTW